MSRSRRYEILLPRKFNNGQQVPHELIRKTLSELERRFGAVSWETQLIRGSWRQDQTTYEDELFRVFIDVEDRAEHRQFFINYKAELKARFQQLEIWMTTYLVDVL